MATTGKGERGQILVIVALGFAALLGVAAVVLDLGNGMLEQRRLQNVADAAALAATTELLGGGTQANAVAVAQSIVSNSTGGAVVSLENPNDGSGTGLTSGIEISGYAVRVALQRQVPTFLAAVMGVNELTVSARAQAGTSRGGVLPIAVKRYSGGDTRIPLGTSPNPTMVEDYLRPHDDDTISAWDDHYASPSPVASVGSPGELIALLGQAAQANVSNGTSFRFWVGPHMRNLTSPPPGDTSQTVPWFIPPITLSTSVNQWKDVEAEAFLSKGGFDGPPPLVGQELAAIDGTDTAKTVKRMSQIFLPNDIVVAMVFDGTVYRKPDFEMSMTNPSAGKQSVSTLPAGTLTEPTDTPVEFHFKISPRNLFSDTVTVGVKGLDIWQGEHVRWRLCEGSDCSAANSSRSVLVSLVDKHLKLQVWATETVDGTPIDIDTITGARTITIDARSGGRSHSALAGLRVGSGPGYYVWTNSAYEKMVVGQNNGAQFTINIDDLGGLNLNTVSVATVAWYDLSGNLIGQPAGLAVSTEMSNNNKKLDVTVTAAEWAAIGKWRLRVNFDSTAVSGNPDQSIMLMVETAYSNNGIDQTTDFVKILGYAAFKIDHYTTNTAYARAISGLYPSPEDLAEFTGMGMGARLMGWSQ